MFRTGQQLTSISFRSPTHGAQGGQFGEVLPQGRVRVAQFFQRLAQLEGHTGAGQALERVPAAGLVGIDDGIGFGQPVRRAVMVRDDDVHAGRRLRDFAQAADAAVHGHDQRRPPLKERLQGLRIEAVALALPLRDIGPDAGPAGL